MSIQSSNTEKRTVRSNHHTPLGLDANGVYHHADESAGLIYLIDIETGDVEHMQDMFARDDLDRAFDALVSWVSFVEAERGWLQHDVTFVSARDFFGGLHE